MSEEAMAGEASVLTVELAGGVKQRNSCVVRLKTTTWADARGLHIRKDLMFLRRQCVGWNILEEDAGMIGADEVVPRIVNLDECSDGIYEAVACNESHDYETGHVDDYDYKLLPMTTAN